MGRHTSSDAVCVSKFASGSQRTFSGSFEVIAGTTGGPVCPGSWLVSDMGTGPSNTFVFDKRKGLKP